MDVWAGEIELPDGHKIRNIELVATTGAVPSLGRVSLRFLAAVDVARIPLYLAVSSPLDVYSNSDATQDWFSALLLGSHGEDQGAKPWWHSSTVQSPIGILTEVRREATKSTTTSVTEILFYAAGPDPSSPPDTSALRILALPLSAELLQRLPAVTTPPLSPNLSAFSESPTTGEFLPPLFPDPNEPSSNHTRKRHSVSSLFDEAAERRKRARRKGGESIAAAAAAAAAARPSPGPTLPIQHKRSSSGVFDAQNDLSGRPASADGARAGRTLSRSPSLGGDAHAQVAVATALGGGGGSSGGRKASSLLEGSKRSSLSRVTSVAEGNAAEGGQQQQQTLESRNKDTISRLVMAGMRMYGLQQRKRVRKGSTATAAVDAGEDVSPEDAAKDEEYKLMYHQVYRGTVFAMRNYISTEHLTLHMEQLRETVDKLLAIFCTDPLAPPLVIEQSSAAVTPAAKQPFGTPTAGAEGSPFAQRGDYFGNAVGLASGRVHTPVTRRQAG